jgi:hypothetical protein
MKRIRTIVVAILVVAAVLLGLHLAANANWPELLRSIHGR